MRLLRRINLWIALALLAALLVLCVVGSFLGASRATALANAPAAIVLWTALLAALLGGLVIFPRLLTRPGLLAMHLACALILVGSIWSSRAGHRIAAEWFGVDKARRAEMVLVEDGPPVDYLLVRGPQGRPDAILPLPFELRLADHETVYYAQWNLFAAWPATDVRGRGTWMSQQLSWQHGGWIDVPHAPVRIRVVRYIPHVSGPIGARIVVSYRDGRILGRIPAAVGETLALPTPSGTELELEVVRVLDDARLRDGQLVEAPDEAEGELNPAAEVWITTPDGQTAPVYAFTREVPHWTDGPLRLRFGRAIPAGSPRLPPAMVLEFRRDGRTVRGRLEGDPDTELGVMWLDEVFPDLPAEAGHVRLVLDPVIRDLLADLRVLEGHRQIRRKVVEMNHPLHHGGYHFYYAGAEDRAGQAHLHLDVRSDSGWLMVQVGTGLLLAGLVWRLWLVPVAAAVARRRRRRGS